MTTIAFLSCDDRKTLAVVTEALDYAMRELSDLHHAQPDLHSAVENALKIAASLDPESRASKPPRCAASTN